MIIKKLKLENIRSYKQAIIDLPLGKTLFEGNIGCGKSTILMAIEFALFGLGSEKGGSLLRAGEDTGSVSMIFECDGVEYTVRRELKRKKTSVQQTDKCVLKTPEGVIDYTPGELKEKILDILDFNEPADPKAQSVIYRYAIYTPQEEMKAILTLRPDIRMQTLRKAFRIEDYRIASEHSKSLQSEIKSKAKVFLALSDSKEELEKLEGNQKEVRAKEQELVLLKKEETENKKLLADLKSKKEDLLKKQLSLTESVGRLKDLQNLLKNKREEAVKATEQVDSFSEKIKDLEPKAQVLEQEKDPTEKTLKDLKDEIAATDRKAKQLAEKRTTIEVKVGEYGTIVEEGVCPTCDRPAEAEEFTTKIEEKKKELQLADEEATDCSKLVEELRELFDKKRAYETNQITLAGYNKNLEDYRQNQSVWATQLLDANKVVQDAKSQLESIGSDLDKLDQISKQLDEMNVEIEQAEEKGKEINGNISSAHTTIRRLKEEIEELDRKIKKKEQQKNEAAKLNDYQVWIQDYFVPTLDIIEQQVMNKIKEDFDSQFQKWFNALVEDPGKEARIDEEFTPLIQQDGMDQDVAYLSGGEKTSVALAYRLALNNIVGKVAAGAKSNLLILDEPTDGFSKEQLGKIREILDEIKNPQVILVSHETELESFADQVIKVSKRNGESVIAPTFV